MELALEGFPTTFLDGGYGELVGGYEDTAQYTSEILATGARDVNTEDILLTVSLDWLGGEGGPGDDIQVTVSIEVRCSLAFTFPNGMPTMITPDEATNIDVQVEGTGTGIPVPGTGRFHYSLDGESYTTVDMPESSPNEYVATLPALPCGSYADFYFSAEETATGIIYDHEEEPYHVYPVNSVDTVFADDFEEDRGWTFSGGQWAIGTPTGGGGSFGYPDPSSAHSGTRELGYNLNGDYGRNLPEYYATSPAIDCSGLFNAKLTYWRWLGVEVPVWDHASFELSTDGVSWTILWDNTSTVSDSSWNEQVFDIADLADGEKTVYLRYTMGPTDGSNNYCGWNIDDLSIVGDACRGPYLCGDANADQLANITDAVYLIEYIFSGGSGPDPYLSGDANCDTIVNITDAVYLITYIFASGPPPCDTDNNGDPDC